MNKKQVLIFSLVIPFMILIGYFLYVTKVSGQHYQSINLLENTKLHLGNLIFSSNASVSPNSIEPIRLAPSGNPYRFNLTVGYTHKVGRSSLKQTKYTHHFSVKDSAGISVLEDTKNNQNKNQLGGNTKLTVHSESLGVLEVAKEGLYNLDLKIEPGNAEIHSVQIHIRKNVAKFNTLVLTLLILAILPGLIMTIKNFSKKSASTKLI